MVCVCDATEKNGVGKETKLIKALFLNVKLNVFWFFNDKVNWLVKWERAMDIEKKKPRNQFQMLGRRYSCCSR